MANNETKNLRSEPEGPHGAGKPRFWLEVTGIDPGKFAPASGESKLPLTWRQLSLAAAAQVGRAYSRQSAMRFGRIAAHFAQGGEALNSWVARLPTLTSGPALGAYLRDTLIGPLAWLGRLLTQLMDLFGFAEVWDFLGQLAKPNTRGLRPEEVAEARKVYGDAITWSKVRIDERSALAILGKRMIGASALGVVFGHTIHFSRRIAAQPGNTEMGWLIHELMHVLQCEATGLQYIGEALHAQYAAGYAYGGTAGLRSRTFRAFNREQQGDIARDYYLQVLYRGADPKPYVPHIKAMRNRDI